MAKTRQRLVKDLHAEYYSISGFANDPEARFFYGQATSEIGVIAATDWNAA